MGIPKRYLIAISRFVYYSPWPSYRNTRSQLSTARPVAYISRSCRSPLCSPGQVSLLKSCPKRRDAGHYWRHHTYYRILICTKIPRHSRIRTDAPDRSMGPAKDPSRAFLLWQSRSGAWSFLGAPFDCSHGNLFGTHASSPIDRSHPFPGDSPSWIYGDCIYADFFFRDFQQSGTRYPLLYPKKPDSCVLPVRDCMSFYPSVDQKHLAMDHGLTSFSPWGSFFGISPPSDSVVYRDSYIDWSYYHLVQCRLESVTWLFNDLFPIGMALSSGRHVFQFGIVWSITWTNGKPHLPFRRLGVPKGVSVYRFSNPLPNRNNSCHPPCFSEDPSKSGSRPLGRRGTPFSLHSEDSSSGTEVSQTSTSYA